MVCRWCNHPSRMKRCNLHTFSVAAEACIYEISISRKNLEPTNSIKQKKERREIIHSISYTRMPHTRTTCLQHIRFWIHFDSSIIVCCSSFVFVSVFCWVFELCVKIAVCHLIVRTTHMTALPTTETSLTHAWLYECVILCECIVSLSTSYLLLHYYHRHLHSYDYQQRHDCYYIFIFFVVHQHRFHTPSNARHSEATIFVACMRLKAYHVYIVVQIYTIHMRWTANSPHRNWYFGYLAFSQACNVHKSRHTLTLGSFSWIFFRLDNRVEYFVTWPLRREKIFRHKRK